MPAIFLTHEDEARAHYYGEEALARLRALGEVRLNETGRPLTTAEVIELAAGCPVIVSYRQTEGPAEIFAKLPDLVAFVRCAVDIRNIDVGAASAAGVVVTRASPGFIDAVAELAVGMMVDLARGISDATEAYRSGGTPAAVMGRQLCGSTLGIIGYGSIGRRLAELGLALGMQVLVSDPHVQAPPTVRQTDLGTLLEKSDFVVCLAVATPETENLIGRDELFGCNAPRTSSTSRAATWSTSRRSRKPCARARSPAAPWTSAAPPTRCPRRGLPACQT